MRQHGIGPIVTLFEIFFLISTLGSIHGFRDSCEEQDECEGECQHGLKVISGG